MVQCFELISPVVFPPVLQGSCSPRHQSKSILAYQWKRSATPADTLFCGYKMTTVSMWKWLQVIFLVSTTSTGYLIWLLKALNRLSTCGFKERQVSPVCRSQCFHWSWLRGPRGRFRFQRGFAGPFQVSGDRAAFVMENKMLSFRCTALTESCML